LDYQHVLYSTGDGIARITINRPQVLNAYTDVTLSELTDAFVRAGEDNTVGVIVITGTGERAFCAGGDINWEAGDDWTKHGGTKAVWKLYAAMRATLKPCIARVNGYAIGGGLTCITSATFPSPQITRSSARTGRAWGVRHKAGSSATWSG
jgi:enoyl-CoA hydratase/carnithine racemase